jgi:hypothetical protein
MMLTGLLAGFARNADIAGARYQARARAVCGTKKNGDAITASPITTTVNADPDSED